MNENAKKYIASSFNAALKRVKSDLGSEAVILSHETINGKTHVIATNNYIPEVQTPVEQTIQADNTSFDAILEIKLPQESNPNTINNLNEFTSTIITTPTNLVENTNKLNDDQNRIIEELDIIKKLLLTNDKQSANTKKHKINKKYSQIKKKLIQHGFSLHLAEHLLSDLPVKYSYEKSYNYVTNKLLNLLNFGAIDFASSAKIKGFVGPSGSGKTRLICKIIMDLMENNLGKNISLIFVNHSNLKVIEETRIYARIFKIKTYYAESLKDLEKAYHQSHESDNILIDFPSYDPKNINNNFHLEFLVKFANDVDTTLVIPSGINEEGIRKTYDFYKNIKFNGICITKMDENARCEKILDFVIKQVMPLRYITNNQDYTQKMLLASKSFFISHFKDLFYLSDFGKTVLTNPNSINLDKADDNADSARAQGF